ncbi:hypothetical protein QN277_014436 [Acacia crassicarpa]|uniref:Cystic fibrosis transmembrane conductance regulator n=1 Tax=Acacia crassicarpa TaxID=499986 RepID=A0AAE1IMV4_9FABA|nr:hypothetical protein QN277_014436 [Acacia crassicarpa]
MVGIFSRFTVGRNAHRRTQSAFDETDALPPNSEGAAAQSAVTTTSHGIEVAVEFKPVEHPTEPLDNDRPIQCPLPEPSIINDGRIWKERASATMHRRSDVGMMNDGGTLESNGAGSRPPRTAQSNTTILPSISAPERNILNLLEECNASGI